MAATGECQWMAVANSPVFPMISNSQRSERIRRLWWDQQDGGWVAGKPISLTSKRLQLIHVRLI
jgi:hypothetical protein